MRFLDYLKRFTHTPNEFYDHLKTLEDAAGGDMDIVILPAMTGAGGNEPALQPTVTESDGYSFDVTLQLMDKAKSKVLTFFNGTKEVKVAVTSTAGTVIIDDDEEKQATFNIVFEDGVAKFKITMDGTWEENDTIKVTVDDNDTKIMGFSVEKNNHFLVKVKADPVEEG